MVSSPLIKMSVGDYLFYRRMPQQENVHKKLTSFNDRKRVAEKHKLAAVRNDLERERMSLDERARQMPDGSSQVLLRPHR